MRNGLGKPVAPEAVSPLAHRPERIAHRGHFTAASSAAVHGVVRELLAARIDATLAAVMGAALLPHALRTYVITAAMSASFIVPPQGGIMPLYVSPATSIGPVMPCRMMRASLPSSPVTHSLPTSGGKTPA